MCDSETIRLRSVEPIGTNRFMTTTNTAPETKATYRRIRHAAHYVRYAAEVRDRAGHDLEEWNVIAESRPITAEQRTAAGIPLSAEWHIGYFDTQGRHHWTFTRRAPLSEGTCERCEVRS